MGDAPGQGDAPDTPFDYFTAVAGQEKAEISAPKSSTLEAQTASCIMLPWDATGAGSGPAASWLCMEALLQSNGLPHPMLIVAGATAVTKRRGSELWVFGVSLQVEEPTSGEGATLLTTLRVVNAQPPLKPSRKPSGEGRATRQVDGTRLSPEEAEEIEARDIVTVRTLSAAEQRFLADHLRALSSGLGWYLVPDGVDTDEGDGLDRLKFYRRFLHSAVDGTGDLGGAPWRRQQRQNLFVQLVDQCVASRIQAVETKTRVLAAAPRLANVLERQLETGNLLEWEATGTVDADTFLPELSTGLPYPLRVHTEVRELLAPKLPEKKQSKQKVGGSGGEPAAKRRPLAGRADGSGGGTKAAGSSSSSKSLLVTRTEASQGLHEALRLSTERAAFAEDIYGRHMKSMMDAYKVLHDKFQTAVVLLDSGTQAGLGRQLLGVDDTWVHYPPPFDPGSRPFVDAELTANGATSGSVSKRCMHMHMCMMCWIGTHCMCTG